MIACQRVCEILVNGQQKTQWKKKHFAITNNENQLHAQNVPGVYAQSANAAGMQLVGTNDLIGGAVYPQHQAFVAGEVRCRATGITRGRAW